MNQETKTPATTTDTVSPPTDIEVTISEDGSGMIHWWAGTVIFSLFPMGISIAISFILYQRINFERIIGDGDLLMLSCMIIIPSLINYYRNLSAQKRDIYFYALLLAFASQSVFYGVFKANEESPIQIVYLFSVICFLFSVGLAYQSEKMLRRSK